jgi:hypothetical protein
MSITLPFQANNVDTDGDYEVVYLNKAEFKAFKGRVELSDLKPNDFDDNAMSCFLNIINEKKGIKLACQLKVAIDEDDEEEEILVARKSSTLYTFLDFLYHEVKGTPLNENKRYDLYPEEWEDLREFVEEQISEIKISLIPDKFKDKRTKEIKTFNKIQIKSLKIGSPDDDEDEDEDE